MLEQEPFLAPTQTFQTWNCDTFDISTNQTEQKVFLEEKGDKWKDWT